MDSDGEIFPQDLKPCFALMDAYEPDIILGSKRHPMSEITYPLLRPIEI
jgi:hypothetical protein